MLKKLISNFSKQSVNIIKINGRKNHLLDEVASRKDFQTFTKVLDILPNPDVVLKKQGKNLDIYRELTFDTQVSSGIDQRKAGIISLNWKLEKLNSTQKDYEFIEAMLNNLNLIEILKGILEAPLYGYQPMEIMWAKDNNNFIPTNLVAKPPEWFYFNNNGVLSYKKTANSTPIQLYEKDNKFLLPRNNPTYANPYGDAILSRLFWSVVFKKGGMKFWTIFSEKYGMPFLVGKYNKGQAREEIDNLADMLENMVQDAIAVIPNDSSVEIKDLASKASSINVYDRLISRCDANISKAILGQTLTTDTGEKGSYALGNVHSGIRDDIIMSDKRLCQQIINQLIQKTLYLNSNDNNCPKFVLYKEKGIDKELAGRDKIIAEILEKDGRSFSNDYLVRTYNYQPDDIVKTNIEKTKNEFSSNNPKEKIIKSASKNEFDELLSSIKNSELQSQIEEPLKPVLKLFKETQDYQTALEKLEELYPQMSVAELEEKITKIIFISDIWVMVESND